MTPCDEEIQYIDDIKEICMKNLGALCHLTIGRSDIDPDRKIPHLSNYSFSDYLDVWKEFDSDLFEYKASIFYKHRYEFCYAGLWSAYVHLGTGRMSQCYCGKELCNIFDNITQPLYFEPIGYKCSMAHCYNGHSFLALGDIPELQSPSYASLRNRKCLDGTEWLTPEIKETFTSKLFESNDEYTEKQKRRIRYQDNYMLKKDALINKVHILKNHLIINKQR